jgi:hypothetical protein
MPPDVHFMRVVPIIIWKFNTLTFPEFRVWILNICSHYNMHVSVQGEYAVVKRPMVS